jgi:glycosyltransferase involved in cell wall biosynthesis
MGVPVIASNLGGLPSLIKEDETGYLCPVADARSFSERIQYLANDRHKLNLMKQAARAFAEDSLGVDNMINGYRDTLLHAIQSRRSH